MLYPEFNFVDVAIGTPDARNNVREVSKVLPLSQANPGPFYATWRRFPAAYREHWQTHLNAQGRPSVAGYCGPSYADYLPFDFDANSHATGDILAGALNSARDFLTALQVQFGVSSLDYIRCYFSGNKGFHILLPAALFGGWGPSEALADHQKNAAMLVGNGFEIDLVIYDTNRMLRLNNTLHPKSGLYKVGITCEELISLPLVKILELSEEPRQLKLSSWHNCPAAPILVDLWKTAQSPNGKGNQQRGIDLHPENVNSFFPVGLHEGEGRDNAAFTLAAACRNQGCTRAFALEVLRCWNATQKDPLPESVLRQKIESAYGGREENEKITAADIATPAELMASYCEYVATLKEKRLRLGFPEIDRHLRAIAPGEVVTIIARSAVGKTAFLQNILGNIAYNQGMVSLFCSMEQPLSMCAERYIQMATLQSGEQIEKSIAAKEGDALLTQTISALGENTLTCGRTGLTLAQLDQVLDAAAEKRGKPVDVIAIDYLGMLDLTDAGRSTYEQVSTAAKSLKRLALRREVVLILLCQVNRAAGEDGDQPLHRGSARDSGAIEESADYLLGLYRPDMKTADQLIAVQILKNRKGFGCESVYKFNRVSMRIEAVELPNKNGHGKGKEVDAPLWYQEK